LRSRESLSRLRREAGGEFMLIKERDACAHPRVPGSRFREPQRDSPPWGPSVKK